MKSLKKLMEGGVILNEFEEKPDSYFNMRKEFYEKSRRLEEERMRKRSISVDKLKDRYLYKIDARKSKLGIWIEEMGSFLTSRFKTDKNFLFDENHFDLSDGFGTAWPMEEIEKVPVNVPKPFSYHSEEFEENEEQIRSYLNKRLKEMDLLDEYDEQILKRENDE